MAAYNGDTNRCVLMSIPLLRDLVSGDISSYDIVSESVLR